MIVKEQSMSDDGLTTTTTTTMLSEEGWLRMRLQSNNKINKIEINIKIIKPRRDRF